jgi:hypothetical protein
MGGTSRQSGKDIKSLFSEKIKGFSENYLFWF